MKPQYFEVQAVQERIPVEDVYNKVIEESS
jgi:hypothetical protein